MLKIDELNQNSFQNDFYASTISSHLMHNHARIEKPHKHNFYAVMLFTQGRGTHEIDFDSYEVKPGSVFFLAPGQMHSWELSEDVEGYIYFHTQAFYDLFYVKEQLRNYPIYRSSVYKGALVLSGHFLNEAERLFRNIILENNQNEWKKNQMLVGLLSILYIKLNRYVLQDEIALISNNSQYNFLFQRFENLLEAAFREQKLVSFYAQELHITSKHLNRICQSLVNKTVSELITDRVVLESKRMLLYTGHSISEVAAQLGYEDHSYFSKVFKKHVGESPKCFRKRYE